MMKKIVKFLVWAAVILAVLTGIGIFTLYKMYPPQKLKVMAQEYVAKNMQREVSFDQISFTWIGFTLKNFALSENATFKDGTFVKADKLVAHVAVKPLLKKHIEISTIEADGLDVQIIQRADGTFNFDTLLSASTQPDAAQPAPDTTEETALTVSAQNIRLQDCDIVYQDATGMRLAVNDLNIGIKNFDLSKPFDTTISFSTDISSAGQPNMHLPVTLQLKTYLANLDMPQAYTNLTQVTARYKSVLFNMQGEIKNFKAPDVNLTGTLTGIDNKVLAELLPDLPNFTLPTLRLKLRALTDLDNATARINEAKLEVQDSALSVGGNVSWGGNTPTYLLAGTLNAHLAQLVQMTDSLDGFKPAGVIKGTFKASEKKDFTDVSGNVTLQAVSMLYPPVTLSETNGTITLASLEDISSPSLTGKLNGENFKASFSYKNIQDVLNLVLNLDLDKLVLDSFETASAPSAQNTSDTSSTTGKPTRFNIQTNVNVGGVKIPYLQADGFNIAANLTDVTDTMTQTNGTIQFALKPGKITNLDNFIKESKIAKIILLPVALVKKVAGLLKVDLFPAKGEDGTTIAFTQAQGAYTFTNGVMNIDETIFNSTVTNISASGTANFPTDELNMKATATLLTEAAPMSFKITGTMSNPKGKLDVLNTVGSVVSNLLNGKTVKSAANGSANLTKEATQTATDAVKGTVDTAADLVKGIGGLFKKKKDTAPE